MKAQLLVLVIVILAMALVSRVPASAATIAPIPSGSITLVPITLNTQQGDRFNGHVAPDLVAYSTESQIRTYRFSTQTDAAIPPASSPAIDLLSDIHEEQVVFTRAFNGGRRALMLYDAATQVLSELAFNSTSNRFGSAIGSDTVAWVDYAIENRGELIAYDLPTGSMTRLTTDTVGDQNPQVSPDGTYITWERCPGILLDCDIAMATRTSSSPPAWTVEIVAATDAADANPDTNGSLVVWESRISSSAWDVMTRPIGSSTTTALSISGDEMNPSISGGAILFERRNSSAEATDLFVYEVATNRLFQLTSTPLTNETLGDIVALGSSTYRITWTSDEEGFDARIPKATTFTIPAVADVTPPVIASIADVVIHLPTNSTATSMPVSFPLPTATDDSGSVTVTTNPASGAVFPVGTSTVGVTATDPAGNSTTATFKVTVLHNFAGFFDPVEAQPALNVINAGQSVPVKF